MALFSAAQNQRSPQSPRSTVGWIGRGSRSSRCPIVVVCFVVCASRSLRGAKKHPTAVILGNSVSIRVPARIPLVSTARARRSPGSGPKISASSPRWFRASRLAGVCRSSGKKSRFFRHSACAFGSFLIPPFDPSFPRWPGSAGRSAGFFPGLEIFVEFALLVVPGKE